ncbi:accessory factor UbiK family protein [Rickettsiella endosymbiont of Dermanyssus gallinae]|uniref:accessory factor UbiK family protein n=1 Tax=Rickettsiella endosymbiont of Dermanyssus gallinae TaxID=2856608 RepID=UPI001C5294D9|nr:accessory factor UbiK family protein [Rickettsiella endosymbiont of Dermanyssus gallinae]
MFDMNFINDIAKQFSDKLPPGAKKFKHDLDKNFRAVVQSMLAKLDLVTREEFNAQKGVLTKTRAKINALAKQLEQLEEHIPKAKLNKKNK